tara:strand:+ start:726 stop:1340 length:615 start_codon:yes stop_codon:yes gene_type:complete
MGQFKIHNLWPIPVYQSYIETKQEWKDLILSLKYERTHIGNSDISIDRYILDKMSDLKSEINQHCENYIRKYLKIKKEADFYLLNSWVNIHRDNDWSQVHQHANALLSGVYYPIVPDKSGNLNFHRGNHKNLFDPSILVEYDEYNNTTAERYEINVTEDLIILFPSHLEHSVKKNISNKNRYSLAFNYFVRGNFGKEEYTLEIK